MIHTIARKLVTTSGETIVETLVSVLISSLAILMLATVIGTAVNLIGKSKEQMNARYERESELISSASGDAADAEMGVSLRRNEAGTLVYKEDVMVYTTEGSGATYYEPVGGGTP